MNASQPQPAPLPTPAPAAAPAPAKSNRLAVVALGALTALIALGGAALLLHRSGGTSSLDARLTPDMPLEPGDQVTVDLDGARACTGVVLTTSSSGQVAVEGCTPQFTLLDRAKLRVPRIQAASVLHPKSGDLVLVGGPDGWRRRQVVTAAQNGTMKVRGYGTEASVSEEVKEDGVLLIRPTTASGVRLWVPVPEGLPLRPNDELAVDVRRGSLSTRTRALVTGGDPLGKVDVQPDRFPAEQAIARGRLRAEILRYSDYVRPSEVLAVNEGGSWVRYLAVLDVERGNVRVKPESGGPEKTIAKAGVLRLRGPAAE